MHYSISDLYPLDARIISLFVTTKSVSRFCQMSPGVQNCPWVRTTDI